MNPRLALRRDQQQEQRAEVRAIGEGMAGLLTLQREIAELLGRPTLGKRTRKEGR